MKVFGEEVKPEWLVWGTELYGGAALIGYGTGEYAIAFGGTMILHAILTTYSIVSRRR
jgi:hypothetical protein